MKINYTQTPEDLYAWQDYYMKHLAAWWQRNIVWIAMIMVPVFLFITIFRDFDFENQPLWIILVIIIPIISAMGYFFIFRRKKLFQAPMKKMIKNNPQLIGPREITFTEGTMEVKTPEATTAYQTAGIFGWYTTDTHEFILLSKQIGISIPRTAFIADQDKEFREWATRFLVK